MAIFPLFGQCLLMLGDAVRRSLQGHCPATTAMNSNLLSNIRKLPEEADQGQKDF